MACIGIPGRSGSLRGSGYVLRASSIEDAHEVDAECSTAMPEDQLGESAKHLAGFGLTGLRIRASIWSRIRQGTENLAPPCQKAPGAPILVQTRAPRAQF